MKDISILSTACGAMFMPGFFNCLKENGERKIKIVGVDIVDDPFMNDFIDCYYKVPKYVEKNYIDVIIEICLKENVDIVFPQISMELPIFLNRIDDFNKNNIKVAITNNKTLEIANNKLKLYDYLRKNNIVTPNYYKITNINDLLINAKRLGYPNNKVVVKIAESSGSRGVRIVSPNINRVDSFLDKKPGSFDISMEEMCKIIDDCNNLPDALVMEYLPGCEYTIDLLADHGKVLYIVGRRNYESQASIAMATIIEKKDSAYEMCTKIVELLELDGNIGFDFMLDKDDNPVLTDLNPRITATIVLYKNGGLNLPYLRVKQLLKESLPKINIKYGINMKRKYLDVFKK